MAGQATNRFLKRYPVVSYFAMTFAISWTAAFCVAAPHVLRHEALPQLTGVLMFPAMLLGPSISGIVMTWVVDGKSGVRELYSRIKRWRIYGWWYFVLFLFPAAILGVLYGLKTFVTPEYAPNRFWIGMAFGIPAGFLEEIGWTGFAFPKMATGQNAFGAALGLGLLWGAWHIPVVNFLGAAAPHGSAWWPFFLTFTFVMVAVRVLIGWAQNNVKSVFLAQLMHVSSTGSLVIFSPPKLTGLQEAKWYAVYGLVLWAVVAVVLQRYGRNLVRSDAQTN